MPSNDTSKRASTGGLNGSGLATDADKVCRNCGTRLRGAYCHRCGQEARSRIEPLHSMVQDGLRELFNFDTRLFRTIWRLILLPGELTKAYVAGQRASFVPPLRLFVFSSFLLFLMVSMVSLWALDDLQQQSPRDASGTPPGPVVYNDTLRHAVGASATAPGDSLETPSSYVGDEEIRGAQGLINIPDYIRDDMQAQADSLRQEPHLRGQFEYALLHGILQTADNPGYFVQRAVGRLSVLAFMMLPVFALLLKLLYIRTGRLYAEHLIVGLHTHAFLFVLLMGVTLYVISGLPALPAGGALIVGCIAPTYLYIAMWRIYRQSWGWTLLKCMVLLFCYTMLLFIAFAFYLLGTLMLM